MTQCDKCRSASSCERPWKGMGEHLNCVSFDPAMTNGDRIRAMSDEELADKINNYFGSCPPEDCPDGNCDKCWLDWLRQEAPS